MSSPLLPPPAEVPDDARQDETARHDTLPPWVIVLLLVFVGWRVYEVVGEMVTSHRAGARLSQNAMGQVDEKTMNALLSANYEAKAAFMAALGKPGATARPDEKGLRQALKSAEQLQKASRNSPESARRVILLRALLQGRDGVPPLAVGKNGLDPRAAFGPALPPGIPADDRARYGREGRLWQTVFAGGRLSPQQTNAVAGEIRAIPNIRWWAYPAQSLLYKTQGNTAEADRYAQQAQNQALLTLLPLSLMLLFWFALGLLGLGLLAYFAVRAVRSRRGPPESRPTGPGLWPILPDPIPPAQRRLRAGDLMGVFLLYLFMPDLIGWVLSGFGGMGASHWFRFSGLLASYRERLATMPVTHYTGVIIVLEFVAYLVSAGIPILLLLALARRRRASLADELGWNRRRFGMNLLYGFGGYAIGLPLMLLAATAGPHLFRHAPAPSNPAIPLLAGAPSVWMQILLMLLATVAAPLTEELMFRGVFLNAAKLRVGAWPAILLTGLIFGFVHPVGVAEMLPLAVLGTVFAWMAETRKSLVPSILAHCLQNTMATLLVFLTLAG